MLREKERHYIESTIKGLCGLHTAEKKDLL